MPSGNGANRTPSQSSMIGRDAQCKYTSTFFAPCIRNCRAATYNFVFATSVICVAPATRPVITVLDSIFLRYNAENGDVAAGALRSTVQFMRFMTVPELVACDAELGAMMLIALWSLMCMLVTAEKDGRRTPPFVSEMPSLTTAVLFCSESAASCSFRSPGDSLSSGVGAKEEFVLDVSEVTIGARRRCEAASSAASEMEIADAFFRVLKANFLGGLKV